MSVRARTIGEILEMGLKELKKEIDAGLAGYPFAPLNLPKLLSKRILFRG